MLKKVTTKCQPHNNNLHDHFAVLSLKLTATVCLTSSAKVADPTGNPNCLVSLSKSLGLNPSYKITN